MENIKRNLAVPLQTGGVIGGVFGFVGDVLQPVAAIGAMLAVAGVIVLLISLCLKVIPPIDSSLKNKFANYWYAPFALTIILFSAVTYGAYLISDKYGEDGNGVMASYVPGIDKLQESLGIVEKKLDTVIDNQRITHDKIDQVGEQQVVLTTKNYDAIKQVEKGQELLKKETSTDPRKELANQGVSWSSESFFA